MGPLRKTNSDYCKKYRQTHAEEYKKKDRERKKLERDSRKNLGPKQEYEEYKALDRARKEIAKLKKQLAQTTPQQTSTPVPSTDSSSISSTSSSFETPSAYKHRATKSRSINRAEKGLPKSPSKRKEVLTSLSRKFNLEGFLPQKRKAGRKPLVLSEEEEKFVAEKLDDPSVSITNPGRNDSIYLGKVNGVKHFEQKRFLLWPLRDLVDILNGNNEAAGGEETFPQKFGRNLRFTEFYKFVKKHKQYVFNSKIPHYNCLCEICENTILLAARHSTSLHTRRRYQRIPTPSFNTIVARKKQMIACWDLVKTVLYMVWRAQIFTTTTTTTEEGIPMQVIRPKQIRDHGRLSSTNGWRTTRITWRKC